MLKRCAVYMIFILSLSGCGYSAHSMLAPDIKTVYVDSFTNKIKIAAEQSDARMYRGYRPGLEADVTRAIIDKFLNDGNLRIANKDSAQMIIKGELIDFRKEPLRYDANDNIEEYRLILTADIVLEDASGKIIWKESSFSGEATYRTGGSMAKSESAAMTDATADFARRVVERTIEGW